MSVKKCRSLGIMTLALHSIVTAAVYFNGQQILRTVEIEEVRSKGMLAAKLEPRELAVSQTAPKEFLPRSGLVSEITRLLGQFQNGAPRLDPLPTQRGEEEESAATRSLFPSPFL